MRKKEEITDSSIPEKEVKKIENQKNPIKRNTFLVLLISVLFFIWHVLSGGYTPYTDQANIKRLLTPVTARVIGNIINIKLHSRVHAGDTLFELDIRHFEIAIAKAKLIMIPI